MHLVGEQENRATKVDRPQRRLSLPQTNNPAHVRAQHLDPLVPVEKGVRLLQLSLHPPLLRQSDDYRSHHQPQQKTQTHKNKRR